MQNILHEISNDGHYEPCPRPLVSSCPGSLSINHNLNLEHNREIVLRSPALVMADNRKADRLDLARRGSIRDDNSFNLEVKRQQTEASNVPELVALVTHSLPSGRL